jgi:hypothetical protein
LACFDRPREGTDAEGGLVTKKLEGGADAVIGGGAGGGGRNLAIESRDEVAVLILTVDAWRDGFDGGEVAVRDGLALRLALSARRPSISWRSRLTRSVTSALYWRARSA